MSYEPTEWQNGDTITSAKLNNIEDGVSEVNSEYTPTNWQNGDVITADKLNNIEQGIVNAAGVRYANMTFTLTNNSTADVFVGCPCVIDEDEEFMLYGITMYLPTEQEAYYEFRLPIFTNLIVLSYLGKGGTGSQDVEITITEGENDYALSYVGGAIEIELLNDNPGDLAFTMVVTDNV